MDDLLPFLTEHLKLAMIALALLILIAVLEVKRWFRPWREIGPFELTALVNGGALLIDLRGSEAHRTGHIAGARAATLAELDTALRGAAADAAVVLYSESGTDCAKAAERLVAAGRSQVTLLRGGLSTWRTENLPLARG